MAWELACSVPGRFKLRVFAWRIRARLNWVLSFYELLRTVINNFICVDWSHKLSVFVASKVPEASSWIRHILDILVVIFIFGYQWLLSICRGDYSLKLNLFGFLSSWIADILVWKRLFIAEFHSLVFLAVSWSRMLSLNVVAQRWLSRFRFLRQAIVTVFLRVLLEARFSTQSPFGGFDALKWFWSNPSFKLSVWSNLLIYRALPRLDRRSSI